MRWMEPSLPGLPRRATGSIAAALATLAIACGHAPLGPSVPVTHVPERAVLYSVEPGDTIERVAAWHGVSVGEVAEWNQLDPDEALRPGRALVLPYRPLATYTVRAGDTLGGLASAFGVEVEALAHLNEIADPRRLAAGSVLRIPADAQRTEPPKRTAKTTAPLPDVAAPAPARNDADAALDAAHAAFDDAEFESALALADRARKSVPTTSDDPADLRRLARAHLMRGMAEVALGREAAARASFGHALDLDRTVDLDPNETSPKVLSVFHEVQSGR